MFSADMETTYLSLLVSNTVQHSLLTEYAYLLYGCILIDAHLCKGCRADGLPARVHDLYNQAVLPCLAPKNSATPISVDLHWVGSIDLWDEVT